MPGVDCGLGCRHTSDQPMLYDGERSIVCMEAVNALIEAAGEIHWRSPLHAPRGESYANSTLLSRNQHG